MANTSTTPRIVRAAVASKVTTVLPNRGACATIAVSMLGRCWSCVYRAAPVLLAWLSLRRTRSVPISVKSLGALSTGSDGGVIRAASASRSAKLARRSEVRSVTTPFSTWIDEAGTRHRAAAAWTNMARAAAPACRN
jgi:hypothetical protein